MNWQTRNDIKKHLTNIPPAYLKETLRAFRLLDVSLSQTIGSDWLDRSSGHNIPYDISSILSGNLVPDDTGILRSAK